MKRKLKLFLACAAITAICSGCDLQTGLLSSDREYNINCADIFAENEIGDDASISAGRSSDIFTEALTAAIKNENMTINMNFASSYGNEKLLNDIVLKLDYAESNKASLKIISNENGSESNVKGYYADEYYYSDTNGNKSKEKKTFSAFLLENDGYSLNIDGSIVSKFGCVEEKDNKIYLLQYDPVEYESALITSFEAAGNPLETDESITVNYANLMFEVDENNIMKNYTFVTNYDHKTGEDNNSYSYISKVGFTDIGSTKIDVPEDLTSYVEVPESESSDTGEAAGDDGAE